MADDNEVQLLRRWCERAAKAALAHYAAARGYDRTHNWIGIALIVVSTLVTVLAGRPFVPNAAGLLDAFAVLASAVALALAAIQTFRNDSAKADRHRRTAATFSDIKREIELLLVHGEPPPPAGPTDGGQGGVRVADLRRGFAIEAIRTRLRTVAEESLGVKGSIWRTVGWDVNDMGQLW